MNSEGLSLGNARRFLNGKCLQPWRDDNSPTGYTQICDYQPSYGHQSTCHSPCNGDC